MLPGGLEPQGRLAPSVPPINLAVPRERPGEAHDFALIPGSSSAMNLHFRNPICNGRRTFHDKYERQS